MTQDTEASLRERIAELEAECYQLRKDRKELLTALCGIRDSSPFRGQFRSDDDRFADDVIAKFEGKA